MLEQLLRAGVIPSVRHIEIYTSGHAARVDHVRVSDAVALGAVRAVQSLAADGIEVLEVRPAMTIAVAWVHRRNDALARAAAEHIADATRDATLPPV